MSEPHRQVVAKIEHTGYHPRLGSSQTIPINLAIRHGYCDFENDGKYNSTNEMIEQKEFTFTPDLDEQDWYWNSETETYQQTAP